MMNSRDEKPNSFSAGRDAAGGAPDPLPRVALDWLREILHAEFPTDLELGSGVLPRPSLAEERPPSAPPQP